MENILLPVQLLAFVCLLAPLAMRSYLKNLLKVSLISDDVLSLQVFRGNPRVDEG